MFGLQALKQLFNPSAGATNGATATLDQMLGFGTVAIISAACCDAMSTPKDEELAANLATALERTGLERPVALGTLTGTRQQLRDQSSTLEGVALDFRDQLGALFQTQGLAAFPLLVIDGRVAFYGGVPSVEAIVTKLASALLGESPGA